MTTAGGMVPGISVSGRPHVYRHADTVFKSAIAIHAITRMPAMVFIAGMFPGPPVALLIGAPRLRPWLPECQATGEQDGRRAGRTPRRRARTTHRENAPRCI